MSTVRIAVDLAKNVFEIAVSSRTGQVGERHRLSRPQFERFWSTRAPCRVILEACSSAHFWARYLISRGFEVVLLPPHYVRPYRRRARPIGPTAMRSSRRIAAPGSTRSRSRARISRRSSPCTASGRSG